MRYRTDLEGCLRDKLYTGVVYHIQGDRVVANYTVSDGIRGGPSAVWEPHRSRVLFSALTFINPEAVAEQFPQEGDYLDGVFFEGVAYSFDTTTGVLLEEQDFSQESPAPHRKWYRSGAIQADLDRARSDGTSESVTYYENGSISTVECDDLGWGLTPEGHLRILRLDEDYSPADFERVPLTVDSRLYLGSQGVTDEIVEQLKEFSRLEYLHLDGTSVSARGLESFASCLGLKELVTRNNSGFGEPEVRKLLAQLSGCQWTSR